MSNSFIKNTDTINNYLGSIRRYDQVFSDTELKLAKDFVKVLEVFEKATDVMQGISYPSLNISVFCYVDIKSSLEALNTCVTSSPIIEKSTAFLLERLNHRLPITENMIVAAFLDPSMQNLPLLSSYCRSRDVDMFELMVKKWGQYEPELRLPQADKRKVVEPKKPDRAKHIRK
ncbi:uncharacterized protein LOC119069409 [Bradysia coprophila]|uniref:uncharacterized protein LOC119069409 n=1 Tax=Bradysia coprophila TaxID=38358 RepID=UPI00187D9F08|nr:uncharacterized protein LOC119069409 [Bradysia coprophila]